MSTKPGFARGASMVGALVAALAAASCCLGPLLLAALGVGGVGAVVTLGKYRPYLLLATLVLLAAGFFFTYRKPRLAQGDACGCENPRANRAGRVGMWTATALVVLVVASPRFLARGSEERQEHAGALAYATIDVRGIDCEACAASIRKALGRVGGFHGVRLDISKQTVAITYEPAPDRPAAYVAAINELGYEAKSRDGSEARR